MEDLISELTRQNELKNKELGELRKQLISERKESQQNAIETRSQHSAQLAIMSHLNHG
jgi:hypothetical protein